MLVKAKLKKREKTVVEETCGIVRVIPTAEEQISCHNSKKCSKNAAVSWASKLNPEDNWDLCENCQVSEFGGWPNGVVPIKTSAEKTNNTLATQPSLAVAPELIAALEAKRQKQKRLAIVYCSCTRIFFITTHTNEFDIIVSTLDQNAENIVEKLIQDRCYQADNTRRCTGTTPKNQEIFENHFGVPFPVPDKAESNIVTVIPKSPHPKAIAETNNVNNASMSLTIASAEHDRNFC